MHQERFLQLARELRMAALGRDGNPPGVSRFGVGALGGRIDGLAGYLPPAMADAARQKAADLGTRDDGLTPQATLDLARWLEDAAVYAVSDRGIRLAGGPSGGGDAA